MRGARLLERGVAHQTAIRVVSDTPASGNARSTMARSVAHTELHSVRPCTLKSRSTSAVRARHRAQRSCTALFVSLHQGPRRGNGESLGRVPQLRELALSGLTRITTTAIGAGRASILRQPRQRQPRHGGGPMRWAPRRCFGRIPAAIGCKPPARLGRMSLRDSTPSEESCSRRQSTMHSSSTRRRTA